MQFFDMSFCCLRDDESEVQDLIQYRMHFGWLATPTVLSRVGRNRSNSAASVSNFSRSPSADVSSRYSSKLWKPRPCKIAATTFVIQ